MIRGSETTLLSDTNVAYKLYFFMRKGVIAEHEILVPPVGILKFHPIVLEELNNHIVAWNEVKKRKLTSRDIPSFLKRMKKSETEKLKTFIEMNLCSETKKEQAHNQTLRRNKKIWEKERKTIQAGWENQGVKAKKTTSTPSHNDYNLLYSAIDRGFHLVTNDEIIFELGRVFLNKGKALRTEDIINLVLKNNPKLSNDINSVIDNLILESENINKSRIFKNIS